MTPVDYANKNNNSNTSTETVPVISTMHEQLSCAHSYTKLVLTGYSGAGKTTTSRLILLLANEAGLFSWLSSTGRVTAVECFTAGIIPVHVESKVKELGNMVIYDFVRTTRVLL